MRNPRGSKTEGLSQEQMDELLNADSATRRTAGTFGKLERGALDNPHPAYLRGVARILRFVGQEWVSLHSFARGDYPCDRLHEETAVPEPWAGWDDTVTIEYRCDFAGNLLSFNSNFAALFPEQRVPMNIVHYSLFDEYARSSLLADWERTWGPLTVAALRAARARHRHNALLRDLFGQVRNDPRTCSLLPTILAPRPNPSVDERPLAHPELGNGWVHVSDPLCSPGDYVSHHTWVFRAQDQPPPPPTLLELGARDPAGFFPFPANGRPVRGLAPTSCSSAAQGS
ncbi:hypothetical protein [Streptomyces sp. NPDC048248]|uniref:MmyB family transcriptional regulator n=1 Tax=Streptomyces sp. NPDC048248 TaxID=3365523 RepID=UPI00371D7B16